MAYTLRDWADQIKGQIAAATLHGRPGMSMDKSTASILAEVLVAADARIAKLQARLATTERALELRSIGDEQGEELCDCGYDCQFSVRDAPECSECLTAQAYALAESEEQK